MHTIAIAELETEKLLNDFGHSIKYDITQAKPRLE